MNNESSLHTIIHACFQIDLFMSDSVSVQKIYQARMTLLQQLYARGFNIDPYNNFTLSTIDHIARANQLGMMLHKYPPLEEGVTPTDGRHPESVHGFNDPDERALVVFYTNHKNNGFQPKNLYNVIADTFDTGSSVSEPAAADADEHKEEKNDDDSDETKLGRKDTLIIVINEDRSDRIVRELSDIWEKHGYFIIVKSLASLQYNVLYHEKVHPHMALTLKEEEAFRKKFNITNDSMIPEISRFDPPAEAIGLRPDRVCRIMRPSNTAIRAPYWRLCKNAPIERKKAAVHA